MKKFLLFICTALLLSGPAYSGAIVVLGVQDALLASDAARQFRETLASETASAEQNVVELEQQARELRGRFQSAQESGAPQDQLQQLQLQFQKSYQEFQRQAQALQQQRAEREQAFLSEMRPRLDSVIKELIEENDISVILNRQSTIYMETGIDITPEVVKRLNAEG